jgi:3-oxoacyl-[acyl-carrier protein] reductase
MTTANGELSGKVAVVTGAGRGIGRAIALAYARIGAKVCCAARTESQISQTAAEIRNVGGDAIAQAADVTDLQSVSAMFEQTAAAFGGIDIVVINAGAFLERKTVEESDPEKFRQTLDVNVLGSYYTAKAAIPYLRKRGAGKMILLGSGIGVRPVPASAAYACAKAGVRVLSRVLAQELYADRISVNELVPGPVWTSMTLPNEEHVRAHFKNEWLKKPEDVVPMAIFLATQPDFGPTGQSYSLMQRDC